MKFSKKILPMVLAMAMVPAMSIPTFAEGSTTALSLLPGEVENSNVSLTNHTFAAYQIFKGDFSNGTLSNVTWGDGFGEFSYGGNLMQNYLRKIWKKLLQILQHLQKQ